MEICEAVSRISVNKGVLNALMYANLDKGYQSSLDRDSIYQWLNMSKKSQHKLIYSRSCIELYWCQYTSTIYHHQEPIITRLSVRFWLTHIILLAKCHGWSKKIQIIFVFTHWLFFKHFFQALDYLAYMTMKIVSNRCIKWCKVLYRSYWLSIGNKSNQNIAAYDNSISPIEQYTPQYIINNLIYTHLYYIHTILLKQNLIRATASFYLVIAFFTKLQLTKFNFEDPSISREHTWCREYPLESNKFLWLNQGDYIDYYLAAWIVTFYIWKLVVFFSLHK